SPGGQSETSTSSIYKPAINTNGQMYHSPVMPSEPLDGQILPGPALPPGSGPQPNLDTIFEADSIEVHTVPLHYTQCTPSTVSRSWTNRSSPTLASNRVPEEIFSKRTEMGLGIPM
ncbi:MAG: hypothetical protein M1838_004772, partial [Thelocarpon superellum]